MGCLSKGLPHQQPSRGLILNVPIYGILHFKRFESIVFLNKMALTFIFLILAMTIVTILWPLKKPKVLPTRVKIDLKPAPSVVWLGMAIIFATIALYIIFW